MPLLTKTAVRSSPRAGRVDDLAGADRREVAVALVGQDEGVRADPPDPGRDGRGAAVGRLHEVEAQVVVGEHGAPHGGHRDGPRARGRGRPAPPR